MDYNQSVELMSDVFQALLAITARPFGGRAMPYDGVSDGAEGVQWNAAMFKAKPGYAILGVNLEGMKYEDWPIAKFIEHELDERGLLDLQVEKEKIHVGLYRDAWQVTKRPVIDEKQIGCSEILLDNISDMQWVKTLQEAYACLNDKYGHRGRTEQAVTISNSGEVKTMEVSPHLTIFTKIWSVTPANIAEATALMQTGFNRLRPVYDYVNKHA